MSYIPLEVNKVPLNLLVPWYLSATYMYYHKDVSIVSDETYDAICRRLYVSWHKVVHVHKKHIKKDALRAGTGYHMREDDIPLMARSAGEYLANEHGIEIAPRPAVRKVVRVERRPRSAN